MPPNCEMTTDQAGVELPPVAAVSTTPYTMDSANVHTPDTRNTSRKSCLVCGLQVLGTRSSSGAP